MGLDRSDRTKELILRYDDPNDNGATVYIGQAYAGTATSTAAWRIKRLTDTGTGFIEVNYADGNTNFDNIWDNRASLSYS